MKRKTKIQVAALTAIAASAVSVGAAFQILNPEQAAAVSALATSLIAGIAAVWQPGRGDDDEPRGRSR